MALRKLMKKTQLAKKADIVSKPVTGLISDLRTNEKYNNQELIVVGTQGDKIADFCIPINATDENMLLELFGEDWSKMGKNPYNFTAKDTGEKSEMNGQSYPIYALVIEEVIA